ncbi:uncharacterized protein LOC132732421, partial [Ruditapes philippinarum]|uniref:uncharacterized protein LOC132732421 n=1 Tax=Ruditapes philippinarum TaxID=129788 RepID=UPI00295BB2BA
WLLVFRGTPGIGGNIYSAWVDGIDVTVDDVTCMTTDVKFAFYKGNEEAAYVTFDATGSDITSWFSDSNIVQSSWTTLATESFNIFSIQGFGSSRKFLINSKFGGCNGDYGYSVIVMYNEIGCLWDKHSSYPQFLFSTTTTFGHYNSMAGMDKADVMAIFIK